MIASVAPVFLAAAQVAAAPRDCGDVLKPRLGHPTELAAGAGFGMMRHPLLNVDRLHAGLDYPGPTNTPIRAAAAGIVEFAAYDGQHGNRVVMRHNDNLRTGYSHLRSVTVTAGQCVEASIIIGKLGSTGLSSEPHLHFEVLTPDGPVDPTHYLPLRR